MLTVPRVMGHPEVSDAWMALSVASLVQKFVASGYSRAAELQADRLSAEGTGKPLSLANALKKIQRFSLQEMGFSSQNLKEKATPYPKIINDLMITHPPVGHRIVRLRRLHQNMG